MIYLVNLRSKVNIDYGHWSNTYECYNAIWNDFYWGKGHKDINQIKWKQRYHSYREQIEYTIFDKHFLKRIKRSCPLIMQKTF